MKFISWNVNGLRACVTKGFEESFKALDADFFCLQETKMQEGQLDLQFEGYQSFWNYAEKKGYSGTAIYTRHTPLSVTYGLGIEEHDHEGRVITLEMPNFYLVTCYTPNAQRELARIDHRLKWDEAFRAFLSGLDAKKPVILCGDLNVAHEEIDIKNPKSNRRNPGFTDEERDILLEAGLDLSDTGESRLAREMNAVYTAFSLNLGRDFICILPKRFGTRIESILKLTGTENRLLRDYSNYEIVNQTIDKAHVQSVFARERAGGVAFLQNALAE